MESFFFPDQFEVVSDDDEEYQLAEIVEEEIMEDGDISSTEPVSKVPCLIM